MWVARRTWIQKIPVQYCILFSKSINNEFEHKCRDEAVRLLNAHPICYSIDDRVPGQKYSIPGLPGTKFLAHQVWAIWFIVRRLVWDADMPGGGR